MTRVVVVGHGMVGSRFAEELLHRAPGTVLTVLGAEEYEPYNRVLLSEVVAGAIDVASLTLPSSPVPTGRVLHGTTATRVDRERRTVVADDGEHHPYDVLVLATGARARIPEIRGLGADGVTSHRLPAGVHALRTLDDAREIVAATVNARRAVVLGGGVLGLEVATGLARRGVRVTVVHAGPHLMDRQLGPEAAAAAAQGLRRVGVDQLVGAMTEEVLLRDGALRGVRVRTAGGSTAGGNTAGGAAAAATLEADLLVLTAGTIPETGLAVRAGLAVGRGIVVSTDCTTSDPAVFAIGDCAEPPEGGTGLIAQGWDQARRLAMLLSAASVQGGSSTPEPSTGSTPTAHPSTAHPPTAHPPNTDVVRLKAHGIEVVTMGLSGSQALDPPPGTRAVRLSDPSGGRHVEVLVRAGIVVGATAVGAGKVGVDLVTLYTRRTPTPTDPAQLLLTPVAGVGPGDAAAEPSPTLMPDRATVCRCNGVTKGDIVACWRQGARTVADVTRTTRATTGCGGCTDAVCGIVEWLQRSDPQSQSRVPVSPPVPVPAQPQPQPHRESQSGPEPEPQPEPGPQPGHPDADGALDDPPLRHPAGVEPVASPA